MAVTPFDLSHTFVVFDADSQAHRETVRPELYEALDQRFGNFKNCQLIAVHSFHEDWPCWEMHPVGDELVVLMEGTMTLTLKPSVDQEESVELSKSGETLVIPRGVWHTASIDRFAKALFITPGEGTQNRELPVFG